MRSKFIENKCRFECPNKNIFKTFEIEMKIFQPRNSKIQTKNYVCVWPSVLLSVITLLLLFCVSRALRKSYKTYTHSHTRFAVVSSFRSPFVFSCCVRSSLLFLPNETPKRAFAYIFFFPLSGTLAIIIIHTLSKLSSSRLSIFVFDEWYLVDTMDTKRYCWNCPLNKWSNVFALQIL